MRFPMPRETGPHKMKRAAKVIDALDHAMPEAKIELDYTTPLELLVAVILSAQCTDRRVNMTTPPLFKDFPSAAAYAASTPKILEGYLKTLGLFRNKAKSLVKLGNALILDHGGEVPVKRAVLEELPGVGKKTAGVVSMHLKGDFAFPVDTHVMRLSRRLGFSRAKDPDDIELDLQKVLPPERWFQGHQLLVWHGRRVCHSQKPECHRCVVEKDCPQVGVKKRAEPLKR